MNNQKHIFFILMLVMSSTEIGAQHRDSLFHLTSYQMQYQKETIYLRFRTFGKNDQWRDMGIMGEGLKPEMEISSDAMNVFEKYPRQKRWSLVCAGLQIITEVAALTTANKSRRTGLHLAGVGISLVAVPIYIGSYKNLNKAVWIRNRDVLR